MGTNKNTTPSVSNPVSPPAPSMALLVQTLLVQVLAMPPDPGVPAASVTYNYAQGIDLKGLAKPTKAQVAHGQGMIAELATFAAAYNWAVTFGGLQPTADQTQGVLRTAVAWEAEAVAAELWAKQCRANAQVTWSEVLKVFAALDPTLQSMLTANPNLAKAMPATVAFLRARSQAGQKAAQTRNAPKAAQTKATKQQAVATHSATVAQAAEAAQAILHPAPAPTAPAPTAQGGASTGGTASGNGSHTP